MTILQEFRRPFNIVTLIISVLSIGLSVYFWASTRNISKFVYSIPKDQVKIYDNKISNNSITVLGPDSQKILDDIYVTSITFWNAGTVKIDPEDVRKPIRITINTNSKLISYRIIKTTDDTIIKPQLELNRNGEILVKWKHLDPKFALKIQLIYSGNQNVIQSIDGHILNAGTPIDGRTLTSKSKLLNGLTIVLLFILVLLLAMIISVIKMAFNPVERGLIKPVPVFCVVIVTIILLGVGYILTKGYFPPF